MDQNELSQVKASKHEHGYRAATWCFIVKLSFIIIQYYFVVLSVAYSDIQTRWICIYQDKIIEHRISITNRIQECSRMCFKTVFFSFSD